jgi:Lsr2
MYSGQTVLVGYLLAAFRSSFCRLLPAGSGDHQGIDTHQRQVENAHQVPQSRLEQVDQHYGRQMGYPPPFSTRKRNARSVPGSNTGNALLGYRVHCLAGASLASMQKTIVQLVDDTDGSEASETLALGFEGATYELDLSDKNAKKLRDQLAPWVAAARKTGGTRRPSKSGGHVDLRAVRAWAASNKIEVSNRGRVSASVIEQYKAAGN